MDQPIKEHTGSYPFYFTNKKRRPRSPGKTYEELVAEEEAEKLKEAEQVPKETSKPE